MSYLHISKKSESENLNNVIDSSITREKIKFSWHGMFSFFLCLSLVVLLLTKLCMQLNACCGFFVVYFVSLFVVVVNCVSVCVFCVVQYFVCVLLHERIYMQ